ncbi:DUF4407 domain-containing protein [Parafilimonas sp.]|uniref:DUF4407 domain-containing protein n=1 Tax=Parafilimonas sp. TaxID=1969739 RepID=UPI0039E2141F
MEPDTHALLRRDDYAPSSCTQFLWWLATAEKELIKDCTVDRNRYAITGAAVLGTWAFATLAWGYFFSTVVSNVIAAIMLGVFMGLIILSIDRALIKGITTANKRKMLPVVFRLILALTIGTFMAQPALLYLFNKEIHVQVSLDNEHRKIARQHELDSLYAPEISRWQQDKKSMQQQLNIKYNEVAASRNAFIAETDGTGGSGKIGLKDIARAKQDEYIKLDDAYKNLHAALQPALNSADSALSAIHQIKQKELQAFNVLMNDGFLTQTEALHNIIQNNAAAQFRYYLLVIILVLIELMPVLAKSLLPGGTYDEKLRLQEIMEKEITETNMQQEGKLKALYNKIAFEQDSEFIRYFFDEAKEERKQKMRDRLQRWKENDNGSFDKMWNSFKKDILTKLEN